MITIHEIGVIVFMVVIIVFIVTPFSSLIFYCAGLFDHHGDKNKQTEQRQEDNDHSNSAVSGPP